MMERVDLSVTKTIMAVTAHPKLTNRWCSIGHSGPVAGFRLRICRLGPRHTGKLPGRGGGGGNEGNFDEEFYRFMK